MDFVRGRKVSEVQKERKFISPLQTLSQALGRTDPKFETLYDELMKLQNGTINLPQELQQKCRDTFTLFHSNEVIKPDEKNLAAFDCFQNLLQDCITFMIMNCGKSNYVQCAMVEFKDYSLKHQTLNFSKTILQKSHIRDLFNVISQKTLYEIICNYTIILKYENDYVQVAGKPLNMDFGPLLNVKKKKNPQQNNKALTNVDPFQFKIKRSLIFYCSHINRSSGLFHRNIFFDKGITVSNSKQELKIIMNKLIVQFKKNLPQLKIQYFTKFEKLLQTLVINMRKVFSLRIHKGKPRCYFECMLKNVCPLPQNYRSLKDKTYLFIRSKRQSCDQLFDQLYSSASEYSSVTRLLRRLLQKLVPQQLIGSQNLQTFKKMMKDFVQMKRYQNFGMQDYLHRMNVFDIPWLDLKFNRKFKNQIIKRGQRVLAEIIGFILNDILIPLIKFHFYVTEQHKEANKIFYFRKPVWILIAKLALYKFSQQNLNKLNSEQAQIIRMSSQHFPQGKLRILPKKGTFRPIITFNKKMKVQRNSSVKQTLQKILANTQLVLRNMKNNLWQELGFSVFDNRQIKKKFDAFIEKWRADGCPKIYYFTLDIKKCYDSINTQKLLQTIETTPFIQDFYFIKKYQRLYRNKRPLIGNHNITSYFNHKERIAASPLSKDPFLVHENDSIPSFTVFSTKQKSITKEKVLQNLRQLCQGSIINYKKQSWSQNYGIPQGLNVSGVLCSLYFGTLENRYVRKYVKKGLLMRLTDDYLYLGSEQQAKQVLSKLMKCARQNQFNFSESKMSKNFYHPQFPKIDQKEYLIWIGKKINIKTLYMEPHFEQNQKIQYAMNVNLKRANIKGFMKNKLKSLLTNHFESYFKPKIFSLAESMEIIKIYVKISLMKFFPFLKRFFILQLPNPQLLLIQILESTFHDYAVYICMLMKECEKQTYLLVKKQIIQETICFFSQRKSQSEFKFILFSYKKKLAEIEKIGNFFGRSNGRQGHEQRPRENQGTNIDIQPNFASHFHQQIQI